LKNEQSPTCLKLPSWDRTNASNLSTSRCRARREQLGLTDVRTENGSSEGHNLAVTGLGVPNSLDSGGRENLGAGHQRLHAGLLCAIFAQKWNGPSISGRPRLVVQIRQLWKQNGREALDAAPPRKPYTLSSKLSSRSKTILKLTFWLCCTNPSTLDAPLSGECGTCKTVKARFWPWLSGSSP